MNKNGNNNFNNILPMGSFKYGASESDPNRLKKGSDTFGNQFSAGLMGQGQSTMLRNSSRKIYDPELTTTAIYLPKNRTTINRWCRWYFAHDGLINAVLRLHSTLPFSDAHFKVDDPMIQRDIDESADKCKLFTRLTDMALEYSIIGEVYPQLLWDNKLGIWHHITIHNPDFIEVTESPFVDQEVVIELKPNEELRAIVHSTKPEMQALKKKIPQDILRRVLTGKNIIINSDEIVHIANRAQPYDTYGTSILKSLFRDLMYEDKLREAQVTIADNFIYPLKLFKLGDKQKGWIPDVSHQRALAQRLQEASFDPNFSLIYHYGLDVEYITVSDKIMKLDQEWTELNKRKMTALGVSEAFLNGSDSYASANVGLQVQMARYRSLRDLFEIRFIQEKFLRGMAKKNGWYEKNSGMSKHKPDDKLIKPKIVWDKKLVMRDDQAYLTFLNNVYANGKGPVSVMTLLTQMGLDLAEELENKQRLQKLESKFGLRLVKEPPAPAGGPMGGPLAPPAAGAAASTKFTDRFKFGKKKQAEAATGDGTANTSVLEQELPKDDTLTHDSLPYKEYSDLTAEEFEEREQSASNAMAQELSFDTRKAWASNISSPNIPTEVTLILSNLDTHMSGVFQKHTADIKNGLRKEQESIMKYLSDLYIQGKLASYEDTNFLTVYQSYYNTNSNSGLKDYSDVLLVGEIERWLEAIINTEFKKEGCLNRIRDLENTSFTFGQLKGYQEQGIENVKIHNVAANDSIRYGINELLAKGMHLASIISPDGEIIIAKGCIEGEDDLELDPHITTKSSFSFKGLNIKDCPIEYVDNVNRYLHRFGKYLKKNYDNIIFVKDIMDLDEWNQVMNEKFSKEVEDVPKDVKGAVIGSLVAQERLKKQGKLAIFNSKRDLYISNSIGFEHKSVTAELIRNIKIEDDGFIKAIHKAFDPEIFNLTDQEIETYKLFNYIEPIMQDETTLAGWEFNSKTADSVNDKLKYGKKWNPNGVCVNYLYKDAMSIYEENMKNWIDYPHKLDKFMKEAFSKLEK